MIIFCTNTVQILYFDVFSVSSWIRNNHIVEKIKFHHFIVKPVWDVPIILVGSLQIYPHNNIYQNQELIFPFSLVSPLIYGIKNMSKTGMRFAFYRL